MSNTPKLQNFGSFDPNIIRAVFPVEGVVSYGQGVFRVKRGCRLQNTNYCRDGRKDREIQMLTQKSLNLLIATVQATKVNFKTIMTLTYPKLYPSDGKVIKKALNGVITNLKNKGSFEYLWWLEFQERGAPHIHMVTTHDGITPAMRISLAEWWVGRIAKSGWFEDQCILEGIVTGTCQYRIMQNHIKNAYRVAWHKKTWEMIRVWDGARRYVTKYAQKPQQKEVPEKYSNVGRFWGCSKGVKLGRGKETKTDEDTLRDFLSSAGHPSGKAEVVPKYLYGVNSTKDRQELDKS